MTQRLWPCLLVLALCAAAPVESPRGAFSGKSFGDGGGYRHPDQDASQHLEGPLAPGAPTSGTLPGSAPTVAPAPSVDPAVAKPSAPTARVPGTARSSAPSRGPRLEREPAPAAPSSAPEASIARAPSPAHDAAAASAPDESAGEGARQDYERRILGEEPAAARPELALRPDGPSLADAASGHPAAEVGFSAADSPLFVSLEIDPSEAGSLRDAVAGLGMAAAFRADPRFEPRPVPGGGVSVSGWLPSSRLGDAVMRPGVRRVSLDHGRPSPALTASGDFLVGVALEPSVRPEESLGERVRDLAARAGFRLTRVLGVSAGPDGRSVATLSGTLPLSRLSRALSRPGVVSVVPAPAAQSDQASAAAGKPSVKGFASYVAQRAKGLALLTLILALCALPSLAGPLKNALSVFIPYR